MPSSDIFSISGHGNSAWPGNGDHREDLGIDKFTGPDQIALLLRGGQLTQPK
jgi:hypothetical protein